MSRPYRLVSAALAATAALLVVPGAFPASKRELAATRYRHASQLHSDLKKVPRLELGIRQYKLVVSAFDAVPRTDPSSGYCDDALMAIGELYEAMAERFGRDEYRQKAVETYAFSAREYPHSKHRATVLARVERLGGTLPVDSVAPAEQPASRASTARVSEVVPALSDVSHPAGEVIRPPGAADSASQRVEITQIRHHSYSDGTRVVLSMEGRTPLKYDRLGRPERLYVDLFGGHMSAALIKGIELDIGDSLLASARLAQNRTNKARLVLDLRRGVSFDAFWLDNPGRLVLDVRASGTPRSARTAHALDPARSETVVPRAAQTTLDGKHSLTRALGLKLSRILIDPGHGGHDTGSVGKGGLKEKDVVLDVSKRLGRLLNERLGAEVLLTRESDVFVPLEDRTKAANDWGADLMISVHCNSARSSRVRGIETYYLDFTSDAWELGVASSENAASRRSVHELEDLLSKIARKDNIDESKEFASRVQTRLYSGISKHSSNIKDRGIRKAPFIVLIDAEMPAVLVEIGFLSNRSDEGLFRKSSFREEVAEYLFRGISEYADSLGAVTQHRSPLAGSALQD